MWRGLQITWRILWRCVELAIVLYVLDQIHDRNTKIIVAILGLIYATIRTIALVQALSGVQVWSAVDVQFYKLRRLLGDEDAVRPDVDAAMSRFMVDYCIAAVFIALVYLVCLLVVFTNL